MKKTSTVWVTRETVEFMLDLPPGMRIVGDARLHPTSGESPAALVFEVVETTEEGTEPSVEPGVSYSAYYGQDGNNQASLLSMVKR